MPTRIAKSFAFDAAHRLTGVPADHPCGKMHGHTYTVTLLLEGEPDEKSGLLMDFGEIATVFSPVRRQLDHGCLNDLPGLPNPTAELLARWIYEQIAGKLPGLIEVTIQETPSSWASYRP